MNIVENGRPGNNHPTQTNAAIRLLLLSANPSDTDRLELEREMREIKQAVRDYRSDSIIESRVFYELRKDDLKRELLLFKPTHLHFSGHGSFEGIALIDDCNKTVMVKFDALADIFRVLSGQVRCVFLNSCYSDSHAHFISKYVPNVVCMKGRISDAAAIESSVNFYAPLAAGKDEIFSFDWSLAAMNLAGIGNMDSPHLYVKENDGKITVYNWTRLH